MLRRTIRRSFFLPSLKKYSGGRPLAQRQPSALFLLLSPQKGGSASSFLFDARTNRCHALTTVYRSCSSSSSGSTPTVEQETITAKTHSTAHRRFEAQGSSALDNEEAGRSSHDTTTTTTTTTGTAPTSVTPPSDAAKQTALDKAEAELEKAKADLKQVEAECALEIEDADAKFESAHKSLQDAYDSDSTYPHLCTDLNEMYKAREAFLHAERNYEIVEAQCKEKIKQAKARLSMAIKTSRT